MYGWGLRPRLLYARLVMHITADNDKTWGSSKCLGGMKELRQQQNGKILIAEVVDLDPDEDVSRKLQETEMTYVDSYPCSET